MPQYGGHFLVLATTKNQRVTELNQTQPSGNAVPEFDLIQPGVLSL
jgi:hypothetical protein